MNDCLGFWANLSSIGAFVVTSAGAIVGISGYVKYRWSWRKKRAALEDYLRKAKQAADGKGQRSLLNLIRNVGLTQDEILKISFESSAIERRTKSDAEGFAESLLFEYVGP